MDAQERMAKRVKALVDPPILSWARKSAGFSQEEAARKAGVKTERLADWESGQGKPSIVQLRKLANIYKRPIAVFYLPAPPADFDALHDFRQIPGREVGETSHGLVLEMRRAQQRREVILDLYDMTQEEPPHFEFGASLADNPEDVAVRLRETLGIDYSTQTSWGDAQGYTAFNAWRDALEDAGVLVFQSSGVHVDEARGFSVADRPFPAVVVNGKDWPRARIFTMLHELTHVALHDGGVCDFEEGVAYRGHGRSLNSRTEVFCNHVAGAALVPRESLLEEDVIRARHRAEELSDDDVRLLSRQYGASQEVIWRRLLILRRISDGFYQWQREELAKRPIPRHGPPGFVPPHKSATARTGWLFTRVVLRSYRQRLITGCDVSDFLGIRLKHLGKIETDLRMRTQRQAALHR